MADLSNKIPLGQAGKRGGSWNNNPQNCRSAYRNHNNPRETNNNIGFRVVCIAPSTRPLPEPIGGNRSGVLGRVQPCSGDAFVGYDEASKNKPGWVSLVGTLKT
jgi:hypothetical protein